MCRRVLRACVSGLYSSSAVERKHFRRHGRRVHLLARGQDDIRRSTVCSTIAPHHNQTQIQRGVASERASARVRTPAEGPRGPTASDTSAGPDTPFPLAPDGEIVVSSCTALRAEEKQRCTQSVRPASVSTHRSQTTLTGSLPHPPPTPPAPPHALKFRRPRGSRCSVSSRR